MYVSGKGGKNRRRGKGDGEESKRELEFKEDGRSTEFSTGGNSHHCRERSVVTFSLLSIFCHNRYFFLTINLHVIHLKYAGQEYAQVVKMLGNGRCECFCFDGVTRLGHIRGKMRKKVWITAGDIVLVGKRDFQDEKVDIVHKYSADEARNLKQYGELPETARINETAVDMAMAGDDDDDDIGIDFDDI